MNNILKQVTFERAARKKDRSITLTFITSLEQTSEEFMQIDSLLSAHGVLYFKSGGNLTEEELRALESTKIENEGKSKSQRLRSVLFVYWQQQKQTEEFNDFYASEMERIIEHYKNKLEDED